MSIMKRKNPKPYKITSPIVVIVIAGSFQQFDGYVHALRHTPGYSYIYAANKESLLGIEADEIVKIGTWYERNDISELEDTARQRLFKKLVVSKKRIKRAK